MNKEFKDLLKTKQEDIWFISMTCGGAALLVISVVGAISLMYSIGDFKNYLYYKIEMNSYKNCVANTTADQNIQEYCGMPPSRP